MNGEKTHPLKPASIAVLRELAKRAVQTFEINPGTRNRLLREELAEDVDLPLGGRVFRITQAGRDALAKL